MAEPLLTINGAVHSAELPQGVMGIFKHNEPVVGIRAHTLPYTQAIGRSSSAKPPRGSKATWAALGFQLRPDGPPEGSRFYPAKAAAHPAQCAFDDFPFVLPRVRLSERVVVAFGLRTVFRLPLGGAARVESAPLDFNVLGEAEIPLSALLFAAQPVEVCVPIGGMGEFASVRLTFAGLPNGAKGGSPTWEVPSEHCLENTSWGALDQAEAVPVLITGHGAGTLIPAGARLA